MPLCIATTSGDSLVVDRIYTSYMVIVQKYDTWVDLIVLDMVDFNIILGIAWLSPFHAILVFFANTITLAILSIPLNMWHDSFSSTSIGIISYI